MGKKSDTFSNRIRVSKESADKLKILKGRTGLLPNALCRIAFSVSMREQGIPDPKKFDKEGLEFNRSTLFGDQEEIFKIASRSLRKKSKTDVELDEIIRAHINRGVQTLYAQVKGLPDLLAVALD